MLSLKTLKNQILSKPKTTFYSCLAIILLLGSMLRFWGLDDIQTRILDETSIPKLGYAYLIDKPGYPFPLAHPPVSNYLFAASIWSYYHFPGVGENKIGDDYDELNPVSYRWLNTFMSCFIPLFVVLLVLKLSRSYTLSLLSGLLFALESTFVVESRIGMNNSHVLFFGLLGCLCVAYALTSKHKRLWLVSAGIIFGLGFGVKWSSIGYILGVGGTLILVSIINTIDKYRPILNSLPLKLSEQFSPHTDNTTHKRLPAWEWPLYLIVLPILIYCLIWLPEYQFNQSLYQSGIIAKHQAMMDFHSSMDENAHPACSKWYTWPIMALPMGYYLQQLPDQTPPSVIYMASFGNPAIYWLSSLGILIMIGMWLKNAWQWFTRGEFHSLFLLQSAIIMAYCANFLPWVLVPRCLFIYHYQPALGFSIIGLAYLFWQILQLNKVWLRWTLLIPAGLIIFAFFNWLPFTLALDIPSTRFESLMWFRSWRG